MISKLNEAEIEFLLKDGLIGRIGCHSNAKTYVVPISYAYDESCIVSHTHEGMKLDMMRSNPYVCFEVDDIRDTANWKSVIAWGYFEEIEAPSERLRAIQLLNARKLPLVSSATTHLGTLWPFSTSGGEELGGVIFRLRLTEKSGRYETNEQTPLHSF